jgi:hypothetical protein
MYHRTAVCRNFFPPEIPNVAHFKRKIQLSGFSAYLGGSPSQVIEIGEILQYLQNQIENGIQNRLI